MTRMRSPLASLLFVLAGALAAWGCGDDAATGSGAGGAGAAAAGGGGSGGGGVPPISLPAEAGFLEVPPATVVGPPYPARMFYSFQPAAPDAAEAPLLLFFNGGPGSATSGLLLVYGTGPLTLDANAATDPGPFENPAPYTRFANLLYLDERQTGFSYGIGPLPACLDGMQGYIEDAGDYVHALLDFLDTHPELRGRRVVLVGESYGGTRAPMMLYLLQHYATPPERPVPQLETIHERLPWLRERVQAHFDAVDPARAGQARTPVEVAAQFGEQALIQPNFFGTTQVQFQNMLLPQDPDFAAFVADMAAYDQYDVRRDPTYELEVATRAQNALHDPLSLEDLLGVELASIDKFPAAERTDAARLLEGYDLQQVALAEAGLRAALGDLPDTDAYWLPLRPACTNMLGDVGSANALLDVMTRSRTFVTNARYDAVVYTEALPALFDLTAYDVTLDTASPAGASRPGEIVLTSPEREVRVRFPTYEAGHAVTLSAAAELGADLRDWLDAR